MNGEGEINFARQNEILPSLEAILLIVRNIGSKFEWILRSELK